MQNLGYSWHQATVTRAENGTRSVTCGEAVALAAVYGMPVAELLKDAPAPESNCRDCNGHPPQGFTCNTCGSRTR